MEKKSIIDLNRLSQEEFRRADKISLVVVLDNVRSLNNVGSIFRTGDAFLIENIFLCGIKVTTSDQEINKNELGCEDSV